MVVLRLILDLWFKFFTINTSTLIIFIVERGWFCIGSWKMWSFVLFRIMFNFIDFNDVGVSMFEIGSGLMLFYLIGFFILTFGRILFNWMFLMELWIYWNLLLDKLRKIGCILILFLLLSLFMIVGLLLIFFCKDNFILNGFCVILEMFFFCFFVNEMIFILNFDMFNVVVC